MNKTGLYVQVTNANGIREMLQRVRPAVVLLHLDGGDLAGWIRQALPETYIVGRLYWDQGQTENLLMATGTDVAGLVMAQKGAGDCHAYMMFNECMGSPVDHGQEAGFRDRAARLDRQQVEFRQAVQAKGKEAVAFNFGAGNWPTAAHYRQFFPLTVAAYKFLGFHTYGWPKLANADPWWRSSFAETLRVIDEFPKHTCILTEVAVTRAYANPGPDEGWLSHGDGAPLSLDAYAADLAAVHGELNKRPNVLGSCLFNAAPDNRWTSFAVTPDLVTRLAALPDAPVIVTPPPPKPPKPPKPPVPPTPKPPAQTAQQLIDAAMGKLKEAATLLLQAQDTFRD